MLAARVRHALLAIGLVCPLAVGTSHGAGKPASGWSRALGGTGYDRAWALSVVPEGVFAAGETASFGASDGRSDAWAFFLDRSGEVRWQYRYDLPLRQRVQAACRARDGWVLAGSCEIRPRTRGYWILRLREDGSVLWQRAFLAGVRGRLSTVVQADGGGFFLAGTCSVTSGAFPDSMGIGRGRYATAMRIDGQGKILWHRALVVDGDLPLAEFKVALRGEGGRCILGGQAFPPTGLLDRLKERLSRLHPRIGHHLADTDAVGHGPWIVTLRADGTLERALLLDTSTYAHVAALAPAGAGGFVAAGTVGVCPPSSSRRNGAWMARFDDAGSLVWQHALHGRREDVFHAVASLPAGRGFLVAGLTSSVSYGDRDGWLVRSTADGKVKEQVYLGGSLEDSFQAVAVADDGTSWAAAGLAHPVGAGDCDAWVLWAPQGVWPPRSRVAGVVAWPSDFTPARYPVRSVSIPIVIKPTRARRVATKARVTAFP